MIIVETNTIVTTPRDAPFSTWNWIAPSNISSTITVQSGFQSVFITPCSELT
jgi:hypothetical protein